MVLGVNSVTSFTLFFDVFAGVALSLLILFITIVATHFIVKQLQQRELAAREARLPTSQELLGSSAFHQSVSQVALGAASLVGWVTSVGGFLVDETRFLLQNAGLIVAAFILTFVGIGFIYYGDRVLEVTNFLYVDVIAVPIRGIFLPLANIVVLLYSWAIPVWNAIMAFLAALFTGNAYTLAICAKPAAVPVIQQGTIGFAEITRGTIEFIHPDSLYTGDINITDGVQALGNAIGELKGVADCACPALAGITNATLDVFAEPSTARAVTSGVNFVVSTFQALPAAAVFEKRVTVERPAGHAIEALSGLGNFTDSLVLAALYRFSTEARGMQANSSRDVIPLGLAASRVIGAGVSFVNITFNALAAADEIFDDPANEELLLDFAPVFTQARLGADAVADTIALADGDLGNTFRFGSRFGLASVYALQRTAVGLAFNRELESSPEAFADYLQQKAWPGWIDPVWADLDMAALSFGRFIASGTPALTGTISIINDDGEFEPVPRESECTFWVKDPVQTQDLDQKFSGALVSSGLRTAVSGARLFTQAVFFVDKLVAPGVEGGVPHVCSADWTNGKNGFLNEARAFVQAASCALSQFQATGTPLLIADCTLPVGPDDPRVEDGTYVPQCPPANGPVNDTDLGLIVDVFECSGQAVEDWGLAVIDALADAWLYSENVILVAEGALPANNSECISAGYVEEPKFSIADALVLARSGSQQVGCFAAALVPDIGIADDSVTKFKQRLPCLAQASFNLVVILPLETLELFYSDAAKDTLDASLPSGSENKNYLNGIVFLLVQARDAFAEFFYALGLTLNSYETEGVGAGEIPVDISFLIREEIDNTVIEEFVDLNQDAIRAGVALIRISQDDGPVIFVSLLGSFLEDFGRILVSVGYRLFVDILETLIPGYGGFIARFVTEVASTVCRVLQPVLNAIIDAINSLAKGAHWLSFGASPSIDLSLNLNCPEIPSTPIDSSYTGNMQMSVPGRPYCPNLVLPSLQNVSEGNAYNLPGSIAYAFPLSTVPGEGCACIENFFDINEPSQCGPNPNDCQTQADYYDFLASMYPYAAESGIAGVSKGFGDCRAGRVNGLGVPSVECGEFAECRGGVCRQKCNSNSDCETWAGFFAEVGVNQITRDEYGLFASNPVCANGVCSMVFDPEALGANYRFAESDLDGSLACTFQDAVFSQIQGGGCGDIPLDLTSQCDFSAGGALFFEALRVFAMGGLNDDWISDTRTLGGTSVMQKFTRCRNFVPPDDPEWGRDDPFCQEPIFGPTNIQLDSSGFLDTCTSAATVAALCYNDSSPNPGLDSIPSRIDEIASLQSGFRFEATSDVVLPTECAFALREEVVSQTTYRREYEKVWAENFPSVPFNDFVALTDFFNPGDINQPDAWVDAVQAISPFLECACRYPGGECPAFAGNVSAGFLCNGANDEPPCSLGRDFEVTGWRYAQAASPGSGITNEVAFFCDSIFLPDGTSNQVRNYLYAGETGFEVSGDFGPGVCDIMSGVPSRGVSVVGGSEEQRLGLRLSSSPRKPRGAFLPRGPKPQRLYDYKRNPPLPDLDPYAISLEKLPEFIYGLLRDPTKTENGDAYTIGTAFTKNDMAELDHKCRRRYDRVRASVEASAKRIGYDMGSLHRVDGTKLDLTPVFGLVASPLVIIDALSCMPDLPADTQTLISDLTTDKWTGHSECDRLVQDLAYDEWYERWPGPLARIRVMECIKTRAAASVFRSLLLADELAADFPLEMFYSWRTFGVTAFHTFQGAAALLMEDGNATVWDREYIGSVLESVGVHDKFAHALLDFAFEPGRAGRTVNRTLEHLQTVLYSHHFFDEDHNPRQATGFFVRYFELFERIFEAISKRDLASKAKALPYGLYRAGLDSTRMAFTAGRRVSSPFGRVAAGVASKMANPKAFAKSTAKKTKDGALWATGKVRNMMNGSPFHELTDDPTCRAALNGEDSSVYIGINCPVVDKPVQVLIDYISEGFHWWSCATPLIVENYELIYYPYYLAIARSGGHNGTETNFPMGVIDVDARCRRPSNSTPIVPSQSDPSTPLRVIRVGHGVHSPFPYRTHNSSFTFGTERNVSEPTFDLVEQAENAQGPPDFDTSNPNFSAYDYILQLSKDFGLDVGAAIDSVFNFILDERPFDPTVQNTEPQGGLRWYFQQALTCEPIAVFGQAPYRRTLRRGLEITVLFIVGILALGTYYSALIYASALVTLLFFPILFYVTYGMGLTCTFSLIFPVPLANDAFDLLTCIFPACIEWSSELVKDSAELLLPACLNPLTSPGFVNPCVQTGVIDFVWASFLLLRWQTPGVFDWFRTSNNPVAALLRSSGYFSNILDSLAPVPTHPLPADYLTCLIFQFIATGAFGIALGIALRVLAPLVNQLLTGAVLLGTNLWVFVTFVLFGVHDMSERYVQLGYRHPTYDERVENMGNIAEEAGEEPEFDLEPEVREMDDVVQSASAPAFDEEVWRGDRRTDLGASSIIRRRR